MADARGDKSSDHIADTCGVFSWHRDESVKHLVDICIPEAPVVLLYRTHRESPRSCFSSSSSSSASSPNNRRVTRDNNGNGRHFVLHTQVKIHEGAQPRRGLWVPWRQTPRGAVRAPTVHLGPDVVLLTVLMRDIMRRHRNNECSARGTLALNSACRSTCWGFQVKVQILRIVFSLGKSYCLDFLILKFSIRYALDLWLYVESFIFVFKNHNNRSI